MDVYQILGAISARRSLRRVRGGGLLGTWASRQMFYCEYNKHSYKGISEYKRKHTQGSSGGPKVCL